MLMVMALPQRNTLRTHVLLPHLVLPFEAIAMMMMPVSLPEVLSGPMKSTATAMRNPFPEEPIFYPRLFPSIRLGGTIKIFVFCRYQRRWNTGFYCRLSIRENDTGKVFWFDGTMTSDYTEIDGTTNLWTEARKIPNLEHLQNYW